MVFYHLFVLSEDFQLLYLVILRRNSWLLSLENHFTKEKKRKGERGREKKGESKGAAYFLKFELNISSIIWRFKFNFRTLIIYLKSLFIDLVNNFDIFVDFN